MRRLHVIGSSSLHSRACEPATSSHQFALDVCQAPVVRPMARNAQQRPFLCGQYKTWLQGIQLSMSNIGLSLRAVFLFIVLCQKM